MTEKTLKFEPQHLLEAVSFLSLLIKFFLSTLNVEDQLIKLKISLIQLLLITFINFKSIRKLCEEERNILILFQNGLSVKS